MQTAIYDPLEDFEGRIQPLHAENTLRFFEELVAQSKVDIAQNRETVRQYDHCQQNLKKLRRKRNWFRFFRVLMIITILLIPVVILKMTPRIRKLKEEIAHADQVASDLLSKAYQQMAPLNRLFTDRDSLHLIEKVIPKLSFADSFSAHQEIDMVTNYDFPPYGDREQSALDVLAGQYNENPFLFENRKHHVMGVETYHGYKTIYWTETYYEDGRLRTRQRSQTLHASVVKPKPFYHTQVVLHYGSQGAPELSFTRDATNLDEKSERSLERHIKKGEKKLKKMTDKAIREGDDFMSMSNSEFEVLFDALDRSNEVQFRSLFTPLAQTNMVSLILSKTGYGDDFHFFKRRRMNTIITQHSQGRPIILRSQSYASYSFDTIRENFLGKNEKFFKAVFFDFAPLLAIPAYQERPIHSLKPIPEMSRQYAFKECEALVNGLGAHHVVHPDTKTEAILKSTFIRSENGMDTIRVDAHSYDIYKEIDFIPVLGGDGNMHLVPVPWDQYIPLHRESYFCVGNLPKTKSTNILATRNNLCIFRTNS